jgi:site-specific recombinase XerD
MTFAQWIDTQPYRPNTGKKTLTDVRYAQTQWERTGKLPHSSEESARRYALYLKEHPPTESEPFASWVTEHVRPTRHWIEPQRRKVPAASFSNAEWRALVAALEQETKSPEATVLLLMTATGHRVADILRIRRRDVDAAKRTGLLTLEIKGGHPLQLAIEGAPDVWARLSRQFQAKHNDNIALWVSRGASSDPEAGAAGYKRCARYLKKICAKLGIHSRVHLHRLRRTVAVNALNLTGDIRAVQDLLGHHSLSSTLQYVDEFRQDSVADLQRKLRKSMVTEDTAARIQAQPQTRPHTCHWPECKVRVPAVMWACTPHWNALPMHLKDLINATYRPKQEALGTPSQAYTAVVSAVRLWLEENWVAE